MSLTEEQARRYARQIVLPEIGESGQQKLAEAKVLVVGAGGLGSPCLLYLAAAGIGMLGIADDDRVDVSNLQRQILHETSDTGRPKIESAADAIADLNPDVRTELIQERVNPQNVADLVSQYDMIVDGSDNIDTRFTLHDACLHHKKPYISAAVQGFTGQLSVFKGYLPDQPCYRCLYPDTPPSDTMPDCKQNGVLGAVCGVLGSWQAVEIIKEILGVGESLSGHIMIVDMLQTTIRKTRLPKDSACMCCSKQ